MSKFVETTYGSTKEILKFPDHYVAMAVMVDSEGVKADDNGRKIIPKGTIVGGKTKSVLLNLAEPVVDKFVPANAEEETPASAEGAEGVLLNDVDVTHGPKEGAMLIHGFIALDKLPYEEPGDVVEAIAEDAAEAFSMIKFIK